MKFHDFKKLVAAIEALDGFIKSIEVPIYIEIDLLDFEPLDTLRAW